ncbi:MAG: Gfo/Idh/MocA family oxidoreductase [Kangiellaceae bacterium]|nr:Gfo/Idh/MocA family oxidoreductase [Kangiellaceae bacterium]
MKTGKVLKMGMIGGGDNAFIGSIHRMAAALSEKIELCAGVFSQDDEKSSNFGLSLGIESGRCYGSYKEMIVKESKLPKKRRIDFVSIVTPNHLHFEIAEFALSYGFHVFCEKPTSLSLNESLKLQQQLKQTELSFAVAHVYTAYPMVIEARNRLANNEIGKINKVVVDYSQGWLSPEYLDTEQKQASWRMSPERAGLSCCMADIGTHAVNIAEFILQQRVDCVLAELTFSNHRPLDDDGSVLLRFRHGAKGILTASQICVGEENNLTIRVYGDKGSIKWQQQTSGTLLLQQAKGPIQILTNGSDYLCDAALALSRTPPGHPQGFIEAFSNLYLLFYKQIVEGDKVDLLPQIEQGVAGLAFIEAVIESNKTGNRWVTLSA